MLFNLEALRNLGSAPFPLKILQFSPIFIRMKDTWQTQNLTVKNKPHQTPFTSLSTTPFSNLPWKTHRLDTNTDAVRCKALCHLLQHRVGHHLHLGFLLHSCFKALPRHQQPSISLTRIKKRKTA